jgi:hypothetical protein
LQEASIFGGFYLYIRRVAADYRASLSPLLAWMGLSVRGRGLDLLPVLQKQPCTMPQRWARQTVKFPRQHRQGLDRSGQTQGTRHLYANQWINDCRVNRAAKK